MTLKTSRLRATWLRVITHIMNAKRKSRQTGFTLVEILVVLAVVAVLASILFAVFARVKETGRSTVCQSNLKQIALAFQQYVQDNSGRYPHNMYEDNKGTPSAKFVHWNHAIASYVKSPIVFRCPTSKATEDLRHPTSVGGRTILQRDTSYVYNFLQVNDMPAKLGNDAANTRMQGSLESKILSASTTVLNFDRSWQEEEYEDGHAVLTNPVNIFSSCGTSVPDASMHSGGANFSFVDGHTKWMTPKQKGEMECADKAQ